MLGLLVTILIGLLIAGLLFWAINQFAAYLPAPLPRVLHVILVVIVVIWLLDMLLGFSGVGYGGYGYGRRGAL